MFKKDIDGTEYYCLTEQEMQEIETVLQGFMEVQQ